VGDIAKGVLGGGWGLLVGWILPTGLNLAVFILTVAPSLQRPTLLDTLWPQRSSSTVAFLVTAVLLGLVLNALQTPLYRFLEGYAFWPRKAYERGCRVQRERRLRTQARLDEAAAPLQRALLREKLDRFPIEDAQIAPTRLGNAIRRFEEYGHNRYRLDTQVLWNELTSTAPEQARRQVDTARTNVDFFVALLYGHLAVALPAACALASEHADSLALAATSVSLVALTPLWYRTAVAVTDDWATAVRALVNVGRKPLAEALGLVLPQDLGEERTMWQLVTRMSSKPYAPAADTALAPYRVSPPAPPAP